MLAYSRTWSCRCRCGNGKKCQGIRNWWPLCCGCGDHGTSPANHHTDLNFRSIVWYMLLLSTWSILALRELQNTWCDRRWRFCRIHSIVGGWTDHLRTCSHNMWSSQHHKLYKIENLTDEEATLLEPAACAIHGLDKLDSPFGIEVLLLGAGPTGIILAQLLKQNGASRVVLAANQGIKMDIAKQIGAADEYVELNRQYPGPQWQKLKDDNPYGFDVVVEATGVEKLANDSIDYVRRGGTLLIYGVYENKALVHWPPSKVCNWLWYTRHVDLEHDLFLAIDFWWWNQGKPCSMLHPFLNQLIF